MIDALTSGRAGHQDELCSRLMLELWHRMFIDGSPVRHDAGYAADRCVSKLVWTISEQN